MAINHSIVTIYIIIYGTIINQLTVHYITTYIIVYSPPVKSII